MLAFLNELSLPNLETQLDVITEMQLFGEIYKEARDCGITEIKIQEAFFTHHFCNGYSFYQWIEDRRADEDLRTLFKSIFGSVPSVDSLLEDYRIENDQPLKIEYLNQPCVGMGLASDKIFDSLAFSFDSNNWNLPTYTIAITSILEDDNGDLIEVIEEANTKNISSREHVNIYRDTIQENIIKVIQNGFQIWLKRANLFPNLEFCNSVRAKIEGLIPENIESLPILNSLFDLQNTARKFNGTPVGPQDFPTKTSPESTRRIQALGQRLIFACPDGENRLFSWHSRFTPGAGRIHFVSFENKKIILIGYIGQKIQ